jgi:hypothetical protein
MNTGRGKHDGELIVYDEKGGLTLKEASQVIGQLIEYRIPTLAGPKVEVVAMLKKKYFKKTKQIRDKSKGQSIIKEI